LFVARKLSSSVTVCEFPDKVTDGPSSSKKTCEPTSVAVVVTLVIWKPPMSKAALALPVPLPAFRISTRSWRPLVV